MLQVIKAIADIEHQGYVYLVGGFVRDSLVGKECTDLDILCDGPISLARQLADRLGGSMFLLKAEKELARVVTSVAVVDFAPFKGQTLQENLLARDFTINALAVEINDYLESGLLKLADPSGGKADLAGKILRVTNPMALSLDPIRVLRGIRLKYSLDLSIEPVTSGLIGAAVSGLQHCAAERIWQEFCKVLSMAQAWRAVEEMFEKGILAAFLPELAALAGVEQNYYHRENAWLHSLGALRAMEEILSGGLLPEELEREIERYTKQRIGQAQVREMLKFAVLMHDIGKQATQTRRPDGRITFYGHDQVGATKFGEIGQRLRLSKAEIMRIASLIKLHMRCLHLFKATPVSDKAIHKLLKAAGEDALGVLLLSLADGMSTAREYPDGDIEPTYREFLLEIMGRFLFQGERLLPKPLLDGKAIMEELGVPAGAEVGKLLEKLTMAQVGGLVVTKEEAIAYLKKGQRL